MYITATLSKVAAFGVDPQNLEVALMSSILAYSSGFVVSNFMGCVGPRALYGVT